MSVMRQLPDIGGRIAHGAQRAAPPAHGFTVYVLGEFYTRVGLMAGTAVQTLTIDCPIRNIAHAPAVPYSVRAALL